MDLDSALSGKPAEGATATEILRADHAEVQRLFAEFDKVRTDAHASGVVAQTLCMKLELHDALEREIFYPAVAELDAAFVSQSLPAHEAISACAERLRTAADGDRPLEAAVAELRGLIEPHVAEEESRVFPRVEARDVAWQRELGCRLVERKEALTRSTESFEGPAT